MKLLQKEKRTTSGPGRSLPTILRTLPVPFRPTSDVPRDRHRFDGFSWFFWSM